MKENPSPGPTLIPVAAGKGGVGKSMLTANLAIALSGMGHRVLAIDLDLGGCNLHHFFGLDNRYPGIGDFLKARQGELTDYIRPLGGTNIGFIPGDGKTPFMANIAHVQKIKLINRIGKLDADFILMDLGAGSAFNTLDFYALGRRGIMVTTPDYPSILGMLGFLKQYLFRIIERYLVKHRSVHRQVKRMFTHPMKRQPPSISELCRHVEEQEPGVAREVREFYRQCRPRVVFNRGRVPEEATMAANISRSMQKILDIESDFFGFIFEDAAVGLSLKNKENLLQHSPTSKSAESIRQIARRISTYWEEEIPDSANRICRQLSSNMSA